MNVDKNNNGEIIQNESVFKKITRQLENINVKRKFVKLFVDLCRS